MDREHEGATGAMPPLPRATSAVGHRAPFEAVGRGGSPVNDDAGAFPDDFPAGSLSGFGSVEPPSGALSLQESLPESVTRRMATVPPPTAASSSVGDGLSVVDDDSAGGSTPSLRSYHSRSMSLSTPGGSSDAGARPGSIRSRAASRAATRSSRRASAVGAASALLAPGGGYAEDLRPKELCMFEWSGGGRTVFLVGSWDGYSDRVPMESVKTGAFRAAVEVPVGRLEFRFIVDGVAKYNPDLPTTVEESTGVRVNVRHGDDTLPPGVAGAGVDGVDGGKTHISRRRRLMSRISGLDMYSPYSMQHAVGMLIFRVCYLLMIPAGGYYFYWLIVRGGNEDAIACWAVFIVAEMLSFLSALISLFGMWKPVKRKWRSLDQLRPALPESEWPTVDVVISHYKYVLACCAHCGLLVRPLSVVP